MFCFVLDVKLANYVLYSFGILSMWPRIVILAYYTGRLSFVFYKAATCLFLLFKATMYTQKHVHVIDILRVVPSEEQNFVFPRMLHAGTISFQVLLKLVISTYDATDKQPRSFATELSFVILLLGRD